MPISKSQQTYAVLKERIDQEFYAPGSQLPREVDLAASLQVSRKTLRLALDQLCRQNIIERIKRKGTFVRESHPPKYKVLIIQDERQPFYSPYPYILPGIQLAAAQANVRLDFCHTGVLENCQTKAATQAIQANSPQGIICLKNNFRGQEPLLQVLRQSKLPILLPHAADTDHLTTGFHTLIIDYPQVMKDGLTFLRHLGHRRIATLFWAATGRGITPEDCLQWEREIGTSANPDYQQIVSDFEEIPESLDRLLALPEPPTAIFSYSDFFAIRIYRHLQQRNIPIPQQLSLLSIGGHIGCSYLTPALSAIDFNLLEIGRRALEVMLDLICTQGKHIPPAQVCTHHIIERESTRRL